MSIEEELLPDEQQNPEDYNRTILNNEPQMITNAYLVEIERQLNTPNERSTEDFFKEAVEQAFIGNEKFDSDSIEEQVQNTNFVEEYRSFQSGVEKALKNSYGLLIENHDANMVYGLYNVFGPTILPRLANYIRAICEEENLVISSPDSVRAILSDSNMTNLERFLETSIRLDAEDFYLSSLQAGFMFGDYIADPEEFVQGMSRGADGVYLQMVSDLTEKLIDEATE